MLIWRGLKPAAIVAAMLSVQSEWKRTEQRREGSRPASNDSRSAALTGETKPSQPQDTAAVQRLVLLDGAAVKSERPLS